MSLYSAHQAANYIHPSPEKNQLQSSPLHPLADASLGGTVYPASGTDYHYSKLPELLPPFI